MRTNWKEHKKLIYAQTENFTLYTDGLIGANGYLFKTGNIEPDITVPKKLCNNFFYIKNISNFIYYKQDGEYVIELNDKNDNPIATVKCNHIDEFLFIQDQSINLNLP